MNVRICHSNVLISSKALNCHCLFRMMPPKISPPCLNMPSRTLLTSSTSLYRARTLKKFHELQKFLLIQFSRFWQLLSHLPSMIALIDWLLLSFRYITNPHLRIKLVEGLVAFSVLLRKKHTVPISDPFLHSQFAAKHLGKALIHFYVDVEVTGGIFQFTTFSHL